MIGRASVKVRRQVRCQRRQVGLAYLMREAIRGRTGVPGKLTRCDEHLHARQVGLADALR